MVIISTFELLYGLCLMCALEHDTLLVRHGIDLESGEVKNVFFFLKQQFPARPNASTNPIIYLPFCFIFYAF